MAQQLVKTRYASSNNNPRFNNPKFITNIVSIISKKFNRNVTDNEQTFIINTIRNLDPLQYSKI